jgi:signal transduction histidine kinase
MRFSIGLKLIASFFLILFFVILYGIYVVGVNKKILEKTVGESSTFLAQETLDRIDKDIFLKIEQIQLFSHNETLQNALGESNRLFAKLPDIQGFIAKQNNEWIAAPKDVITPFMEEIIKNELSQTLRVRFIEFGEKKYGQSIYGEAFVTNAYGANSAQTGKTTDYEQADEEWWQKAKQNGFFVGEAEYDESSRALTTPIAVRIDDTNGNFLGVIKAVPIIEEILREAVVATKRYETTEATLLTVDGRLILSPNASRPFEDISGKNFFKNLNGERGFFVDKENGKVKLFAYTRSHGFKDFEGLQWILVLAHDGEEIFEPVLQLQRALTAISIAFALLIGSLAVSLSRAISKPTQKLIQELEERVQELDRTAKLLVRRDFEFLQTNEMLRELDEAKSRFVSTAAHQLRTPISGIKWTINMFLSGDYGKLSREQKSVLQEVLATLDRLITLISDLLNVARIESGQLAYKFLPIHIEDVCRKVFNESALQAKKRGVALNLFLPSKPLSLVRGDFENLTIALQNIVENALTYTHKRGKVEIRAKEDAHDPQKIQISVQDTGMGIPVSQKSLLGQKFFRADNAVREQIPGTGLGLYMVEKILEQHKGKLQVESEEKKGSTFTMILPAL